MKATVRVALEPIGDKFVVHLTSSLSGVDELEPQRFVFDTEADAMAAMISAVGKVRAMRKDGLTFTMKVIGDLVDAEQLAEMR